jgi:hypothetical protein
MNNNQKIKTGRGGKRQNAGRRKGSFEKLRASTMLNAIQKTCGKPLAYLIAEHYQDSVDRGDWQAVRDYEKTFMSKFVADKVEMDHTSNGQTMQAVFQFPQRELQDWNTIPKTITVDEKD